MSHPRITDNIGILALEGTEYDDEQVEHVTTINTENLKKGIDILDTLEWPQVDVHLIASHNDSADYPALALSPPTTSAFGNGQAAIVVAPLSDKGRREE